MNRTCIPLSLLIAALSSGCISARKTSVEPLGSTPHMPASIPKTIDYVEIPSSDVARSRAFFVELLGWRFVDYGPDYTSFEDGRMTGGFFRSEEVSRTDTGAALLVVYAEGLQEIRDRVIHLGGRISKDIFSFPGGRRFHFIEPGGSEFGIWSDK